MIINELVSILVPVYNIEKTIEYIGDRYTGKAQVLEDGESTVYKIYNEKEMLELMDASVIFILKMIKKHANDVLKNDEDDEMRK